MELVAGGTLEAKVREAGPLPVGQAVDAILQIINGLEAAQKLGVLHRDIKASNCFLDASGAVKVGDFGLSVSTATKTDLKLTTTGSFLGTPSYASPEQLRGQEMDVRSDIYSVGVTLFYILTGKIPFEADSFVQLIAAVLEQPTPSASQLRKEVPRELAAVVSRCLEKQPAKRFQNYKELRTALQPFTSDAPIAAGIPIRILAGIIDSCVLFCVSLFQMAIASTLGANPFDPDFMGSALQMKIYAISALWTIAYFAISESFWGATVGKALCGIRVIDAKRGYPSLIAAFIRAAIYYVAPCLPTWILLGFRPPVTGANSLNLFPIVLALALYPMLALLFCTARRRNGNAALQDLASGTRVILKPESDARPNGDHASIPTTAEIATTEKIGPYRIVRKLDHDWQVGHDDKLGRNVWIRRCKPDAASFSTLSGNVARPGRLRWLGGKRDASESWDAFEEAPGASFRDVITQPRNWDSVRYWLTDLAQELAASERDGTTPKILSLDRVWITTDNRAKLLDYPVPGTKSIEYPICPSPESTMDDRSRQFLWTVAASALSGKALDADTAKGMQIDAPLPLHARDLLSGLRQLPPPQVTAAALRDVLKKHVRVTRLRRIALLFACCIFPLFTGLFPLMMMQLSRQWEASMPNIAMIHALMFRYADIPIMTTSRPKLSPQLKDAIEIVIASKYASDINNPQIWNSFYTQSTLPQWEREAAQRIINERKPASGEELAKAEAEVDAYLKKNPPKDALRQLNPFFFFLSIFIATLLIYVAFPAFLAAIGFRGGLLLAILGLVIVDRAGRPAARWRVAVRSIFAWSIAPLMLMLAVVLIPSLGQGLAAALALILYFGICLASALIPHRGIPDRLAGTYLVMR